MPATLNLEPALSFLDELRQNNNKAWFDSHRPAYEAARGAFEHLINDVIDEFRVSDNLQGLAAKNCIARIYRDVRFAKDKTPYKTNLGAMIAPGGWKTTAFGYYIGVEPHGQSIVAGGLYAPTPEQLNRFRQAIDEDAATFKKVTHAKDFVEVFGEIDGDRLKTAPKGYDRASGTCVAPVEANYGRASLLGSRSPGTRICGTGDCRVSCHAAVSGLPGGHHALAPAVARVLLR